jgi:hypothetical protein
MPALLIQKLNELCTLLEEGFKSNSITNGNKFKYFCVERFILTHGKYFTLFSPMTVHKVRSQCYFQAANLALSNSEITYVEGYILNPNEDFFISHAWASDNQGRIIETALQDDSISCEYFGVPFKTDFLTGRFNNKDSQGLFQVDSIRILNGEYDNGVKIIANH